MDSITNFIGDVIWLCCGWVIVGGLAGGIARFITRSKDKPFLNDLLLGMVGSVIGGVALSLILGTDDIGGTRVVSFFIAAVVGSIILIFLGRFIRR